MTNYKHILVVLGLVLSFLCFTPGCYDPHLYARCYMNKTDERGIYTCSDPGSLMSCDCHPCSQAKTDREKDSCVVRGR